MAKLENDTLRILVVDDTSLARHMVSKLLVGQGFQNVAEANDGKSAFLKIRQAHAEKQPFHLVLCDWNMPEVDGLGLLKACRSQKEFETLPFIMITAEGAQEKIFDALLKGATDYLVKPYSPENLKQKVLLLVASIQGKAS